jgi:peptidoglycan hydrolase-like amidase
MEKNKTNIFYPAIIGYSGWKYYNIIKKKAISQINEEFTFSSLLVSLIIAFFICTGCATALSCLNIYLERSGGTDILIKKMFYSKENNELQSGKNLSEQELRKIMINSTLAFDNFKKKTLIRTVEASSNDYQGESEKFTHYIRLKPNQELKYQIKVKNIGGIMWKKDETTLETGPFLRSFSKIKHDNWVSYFCPVKLSNDVGPKQTATFDFNIKGPQGIIGDIQENFQVVINGRPVQGSLTRIFLNVYDDSASTVTTNASATNSSSNSSSASSLSTASSNSQTTTTKNADFCIALTADEKKNYSECNTDTNEKDNTNGISQNTSLANAPMIRVGLYSTKNAQRTSINKPFDVYSGTELLISGAKASDTVIIGFDLKNKRYSINYGSANYTRSNPIRIVPREQGAVATLPDFDSRPVWNTYYNDNTFRNIIEFQYSKDTGKFWVINELPITHYLKGMAETSNYSPIEFQKVLITAARTYAMYHYNRGVENKITDGSTKHASEHYHVDAVYDQVYRGYNSELRMPKLSQAVDETEGMVITYDNKVVITPYFSRSDGRTRSWEEVWSGGSKPWLKSVSVPQDKGQTLWGHGVGMSARGALIMARDENKKWDSILKYFYQGITLKKIY